MQPITDPAVPFVGPVKLNQGEIVRIQGFVPSTADRFNINLHCGSPPSDIALHISIRLLQNYIARNSLEIGSWGNEEGTGGLPIGVDQGFEILILCDRQNYKIAINGNHFCEFVHRVPFQQVTHLAIDGDVALKLISYENGPSAPPPMGASDYGPPPTHYGEQRQHSREGPTRPKFVPIPKPTTVLLQNQPPPVHMPLPSSVSLPPYGMPMPSHVSLPPTNMPMPSSPSLPRSGMPMPTGPVPNYHMSTQPTRVYPVQTYGSPYVNNVPPYGNNVPLYGSTVPAYGHNVPPYGNNGPSYGNNVPPYGNNIPPYGNNIPPYGNNVPPPYPMNAHVPYNKKEDKKMKKKLKKAAKYGIPIAAVGVGAYAVSRALHRSSSSSSSSSSD